jgi:ubiquinone/menaquinone biosynthesis C-methylase UbiE
VTENQSFFTDGEAYERMMGRWTQAAGAMFLDWLAMPPGLRWLDAGCGTGAFTELLVARCAPREVAAIDPAADQIAFARSKPIAKQVKFQIGDSQSLPFASDEFDAATMALVITFIPDPQKAVAELKRVVKPGGTIGTYMWDFMGKRFTQQPLREAVEAMGYEVPPAPGHPNSTLEALERFFTTAKLDDVATRTIEIEIAYGSFDEYWSTQTGLANSVVQYIRKMSPAELERLKGYLQEHLPRDRNGGIAYKARANAVKGRVPH